MIDLGEPLHSSDTAFVRASEAEVFSTLCDAWAWPAFWPGTRTLDHQVGDDPPGGLKVAVGDRWRARTLLDWGGADCEVVVTDLRVRDNGRNLWMDWRGTLDVCVGLPLGRRPLEAEAEWFVRDWRGGALVTQFWRVRSVPRRRQERLLLALRRSGWRGMSGLKRELEEHGETDGDNG